MLSDFIDRKLKTAKYKILRDGNYFAEIPNLRGVWAHAKTLERCRTELREVLEDWLVLKIRNREPVSGFSIKADRRNLVRNA